MTNVSHKRNAISAIFVAIFGQIAGIVPKLLLAITAVTSMLVTLATGTVAQTVPPNLPAAVICYNQNLKVWLVGYLHIVKENGDATYSSVIGAQTATLNAKGVVEAPTDRPAGNDCIGKTVEELRSNGRVVEFQRTR